MLSMMQRIGVLVALATSLTIGGFAAAGQIKYTYLKVGEGEGALVYAFTSKQACEAARRKYDADWARMIRQLKKNIGNHGTFAAAPRARCMNSLPYGFVRRRVEG